MHISVISGDRRAFGGDRRSAIGRRPCRNVRFFFSGFTRQKSENETSQCAVFLADSTGIIIGPIQISYSVCNPGASTSTGRGPFRFTNGSSFSGTALSRTVAAPAQVDDFFLE